MTKSVVLSAFFLVFNFFEPNILEQPLPVQVWRFDDPVLDESSGLVSSRNQPGILWSHNDSNDLSRIFALTPEGHVLDEITVEGAKNVDWEDIALDDRGNLYIGDTGNNRNRREDLKVYVIPEPKIGQETAIKVQQILPFYYPEQRNPANKRLKNFDSESLFWARGRLYLLTKHRSDTRTALYRFPEWSSEDLASELALERISDFDLGAGIFLYGGMATGADASQDGRYLAVLSYHALFLFERPPNSDDYLSNLALRIDLNQGVMQQCEGIAWAGEDLLISNEQGMLFRLENPIHERPAYFPK